MLARLISHKRTSNWHLHGLHGSQRSLFNLSNLSPLSIFGAKPVVQKYHKILPYPRKQVYAVISDVSSYSDFVPFCIKSKILSSSMPEPGSSRKQILSTEHIVEFLSYKESYFSKVTCVPDVSIEATTSSSLFKSLSACWEFQPASPQSSHSLDTPHPKHADSTRVTLNLVCVFVNPIHAGLCATVADQLLPYAYKTFEERCLSLYGPPGNQH